MDDAFLEHRFSELHDRDEDLARMLREDYLTGDQMRLTFVTRDEVRGRRRGALDVMLACCAIAGALEAVAHAVSILT